VYNLFMTHAELDPSGVPPEENFFRLRKRPRGEPRSIQSLVDSQDEGSAPIENVSDHAVSKAGTVDQKRDIFSQVTAFLQNLETTAFIESAFHIPGRPITLTADGDRALTGTSYKHGRKVYSGANTSIEFIIESVDEPIAHLGFNQFSDGVEITFVQGAKPSQVPNDHLKRLGALPTWRNDLVDLVERYAQHRGFSYVLLRPGHKQEVIGKDPKEKAKRLERVEKIYRDLADVRKYTYNDKLQRFVKPLFPTSL
jgi:hypothetical protein